MTDGVSVKVLHDFVDNLQYREKAIAISKQHKESKGGTLVLVNSFEEACVIAETLTAILPQETVLYDTPDSGHGNTTLYTQAYKETGSAIWCAVGAAWTGLDLTHLEAPAKDDHLIGCLVITRAPFEFNRSDSPEDMDWVKYVSNTFTKFRQGIGRLVRRPGRQGMTLLYLDAEYHKHSRVGFKRYLNTLYDVQEFDSQIDYRKAH